MNITKTHHIDASEPYEDGSYEYHYEYDLYRFEFETAVLIFRSYTDTPREVSLLRAGRPDGTPLNAQDLVEHPFFQQARDHLTNHENKSIFKVLGNAGHQDV